MCSVPVNHAGGPHVAPFVVGRSCARARERACVRVLAWPCELRVRACVQAILGWRRRSASCACGVRGTSGRNENYSVKKARLHGSLFSLINRKPPNWRGLIHIIRKAKSRNRVPVTGEFSKRQERERGVARAASSSGWRGARACRDAHISGGNNSTVFDCFRLMELAEIGRCRASVLSPAQAKSAYRNLYGAFHVPRHLPPAPSSCH